MRTVAEVLADAGLNWNSPVVDLIDTLTEWCQDSRTDWTYDECAEWADAYVTRRI